MSTISITPGSFAVAAPKRRLRLTDRGRTVLILLIGLPIALWLLLAQLNGGAATGTLEDGAAVPIVMVQPGESLWTVAERVAPGADPRDVIAAIVDFNHLGSADVMAGQQIAIPAPYNR
ncbi:MAG: LysM peptidoglycan-binding domain-containing protein [Microbacteriaceae bacterium]|nr:LysM peptidoglycan-binding domain-containing protein [Microbacteriaceae bacterium]